MTEQKSPKTQAREIIEALPETASWDDLMYELYVREAIEAGLADVAAVQHVNLSCPSLDTSRAIRLSTPSVG